MSLYEDGIQIQKIINLLLEGYMDDNVYQSLHDVLKYRIDKYIKDKEMNDF